MQFSIAGTSLFTDFGHTALLAILALQTLALVTRRLATKAILEFSLTFLNVVIFLFLNFYFDTLQSVTDKAELTLDRILFHLPEFFADPTHLYILAGGFLLAFGLALGRTEVLRLKERKEPATQRWPAGGRCWRSGSSRAWTRRAPSGRTALSSC